MLTRLCSKFFKLDFSSEPRTSGCKNWTYKRQRNQISNCQHPSFHTKIKAIQKRKKERKIYFCFIDYIKDFVWMTTNWKILKEMGIPDHLTCLPRNLYAGQEATVRTLYGTTGWFKIGKGVCQGCILSLYIIYCTSWEMPGWLTHKTKSRLPGELSVTSDMQMMPLKWQKEKRN